MTLRRKILIGYGVVFVFLSVVVGWAVINLVFLGMASNAILHENYRSILAAENMVDALERQDSAALLMIAGDVENGVRQFRENESDFLQWLTRARDNITVPGEAELVLGIKDGYSNYQGLLSKVMDVADRDRQKGHVGVAYYHEMMYPIFADVRERCIHLRKINEEAMYAASGRANHVSQRAIWSTVVVAASCLGVALVFCLVLSERLTRPLKRFMEASRKIADGDYTVRLPVNTRDELGLLADELNKMGNQLLRYHEMNISRILAEEQKIETILTSIEDGLVVFSLDGRVADINPAARRLLGLEFGQCLGKTCQEILPDQPVCHLISATAQTGRLPVIHEDNRYIAMAHGESAARHLFFALSLIRAKDGCLTGIVLLLRDVTRLKEVERLKSDFVMAASHELRTPLTSIGMGIDLLLEHAAEGLSPRDRELLQAAHEEVHRLKALVNDLLDLSKIEAGRIQLEFEHLSLRDVMDRVAVALRGQIEEKAVKLEVDIPADLPRVRADLNKITWVLINLVSNALRFVPKGGHIRVRGEPVGAYVHLSVCDDGPGIPAEYQSKIFQKFVQVKGVESGGTGLGLAICKEIVRAHGGSIWVESSPGKGSTFTFALPMEA